MKPRFDGHQLILYVNFAIAVGIVIGITAIAGYKAREVDKIKVHEPDRSYFLNLPVR